MASPPAKSCLAPIVNSSVQLLILGSLPGEASLAAERYYAHPRNQFWRLLETVLEAGLQDGSYEERLQILLQHGVGLWDTVASAERQGSLDGAMRSIAANPLPQLIGKLPNLRAVAFNGGTAARIGRREIGATELTLIDLPSSSPALTMAFTDKAERWAALRPFTIDSW